MAIDAPTLTRVIVSHDSRKYARNYTTKNMKMNKILETPPTILGTALVKSKSFGSIKIRIITTKARGLQPDEGELSEGVGGTIGPFAGGRGGWPSKEKEGWGLKGGGGQGGYW